MNRLSVEKYKEASKIPLVIVLNNIRSVYNVGSIFRTADAFRVNKLYLCGITAQPPIAEIHKTALGAEDSVDWEYFENTLDCVKQLKAEGFIVISVEQVEQSLKLQNWTPSLNFKYALVVGNEVKGVQQDVVDAGDGCLEIPQFGTKHSLNVSCAASIVMWEYFSQFLNGLGEF